MIAYDKVSELENEFLEQGKELEERFDERAEDISALVVGKFEELVEIEDETCEEFLASFEYTIESELKAGFESIHEEANVCLDRTREHCFEFVDDMSGQLASTIKNSLIQAVENIKDRLESRLKDTGDEVKDSLIQEVKEEALRIVITTQMGAQITTMIQPYLPQLMLANALAPSIQSALKIMRMGF